MHPGFTLIELLVVITIIVVLLSLLTPALDKAIYQAELAICASFHRAAGGAMMTYAMNHRRYFNPRVTEWTTYTIANGSVNDADDRPPYRPYFDINSFLCPPAGSLDLDWDDSEEVNPSFVEASINMFAGWGYDPEVPETGAKMAKIGDRWGWNGDRFDVMLNDVAATDTAGGTPNDYSAHPDDDGVFTHIEYDSEDWEHSPAGVAQAFQVTWAGWFGRGNFERGLIEMNAMDMDGGVYRVNDVPWDHRVDDRLRNVPYDWSLSDGGSETNYILVPRP